MMYGRMLFVMLLSLYTVRVVLRVLGVEDYGIFDVVAGLVSVLAVVSGTMETATQRYYAISIGEKIENKIKQIFSLSVGIYIIISVFILILGETIGLWFVNSHLQIPAERMVAANWIYQFSLISIVLSMLTVPFSSMMIAHEDIGIFSVISIIENVLKLLIVYAISLFDADKLIVYGALGVLVVLVKFFIFIYFTRLKYKECRFMIYWDAALFKSMLAYSGWTLFGAAAGVANNQGNNILINIFFGPVTNASRSIAFQVSNAVSSFCNNLFVVMRPPMIKSYAENNTGYMMYLFYLSSRLSYYLMLMIFIPLIIETNTVLILWLGRTSEEMVVFTRLTLIYTIILSQHNPITTIIQATGRVKIYFSVVESSTLLSLPLTYVFFKSGYPAATTFVISILVFLVAHFLRLYILKKVIIFSIFEYIKKFIFPILLVSLVSFILPLYLYFNLSENSTRLIYITITSTLSTLVAIYLLGINRSERLILRETCIKVLHAKRLKTNSK